MMTTMIARTATTPVCESEYLEALRLLERLPSHEESEQRFLSTPSYHVDRAVREALLAPVSQWHQQKRTLIFTASNGLCVSLGHPARPLDLDDARFLLSQRSLTTVLTARIALGLWSQRRASHLTTSTGFVALRTPELLQWRGIKKQMHSASSAGSQNCWAGGYSSRYKEQVAGDLYILSACWVSGSTVTHSKGKRVAVQFDSPYLLYKPIFDPSTRQPMWPANVLVAPGDWITGYEMYENYFLALMDRTLLSLHTSHQSYALRLALSLCERWRQLAASGNYATTISMRELLAASMIPAPISPTIRLNIEHALQTLWECGLLGQEARCIQVCNLAHHTANKQVEAWLDARWLLSPSQDIAQAYQLLLAHGENKSSHRVAERQMISR